MKLFLLMFWWSAPAFAFNWTPGPSGSEAYFRFEANDFSSYEEDEIELGAFAWNAGAGEILRGADWEWVKLSDRTSTGINNGYSEVFAEDQLWFWNHFLSPDLIAVTIPSATFDTDIVFNTRYTFCASSPSSCTNAISSPYSIGQTAMHEFGHYLGLGHEDDNIATMNTEYPAGGDIGGARYRINEDDYAGLVDRKGDSSTGKNLMLSRFSYSNDQAYERWDTVTDPGEGQDGQKTWDRSDDDWFPGTDAGHPGHLLAIFEGTSGTLSGVDVEWRLIPSDQSVCFDGAGEYTIGHRSVDLGVNTPYSIGPDDWDLPATVPLGFYILCAKIDPGSEFTETSEGDNLIYSEVVVEVKQ